MLSNASTWNKKFSKLLESPREQNEKFSNGKKEKRKRSKRER